MSTPENNKPNTGRAEALSPERHGGLRFHKTTSFAFAEEWLFVPVHYREASQLARQFPVLFYQLPNGSMMPCMLLKSEGKAAISPSKSWQAGVLPDVLRFYPFGINNAQGPKVPVVYPDAPHFRGKGEKIITSKGKPTQKLYRTIKQLGAIQKMFDETGLLMKELQRFEVLKPVVFSKISQNGKKQRIKLFACPDRSVLREVPLSNKLHRLLFVHQQSCKQLFNALTSIENKQEQATESVEPTQAPATVQDLVLHACKRFDVSVDDLRSRKRGDAIKRARSALAADALSCDSLPELAIYLERSVDTVKKWI